MTFSTHIELGDLPHTTLVRVDSILWAKSVRVVTVPSIVLYLITGADSSRLEISYETETERDTDYRRLVDVVCGEGDDV